MKLANLLLLVSVVVCGMSLSAQTWDETINGGGDAGDLPGTAQVVTGSGPLTEITGDNPNPNDRDLFRIRISNPAIFSATTVINPGTNSDNQLWLFHTDGTGIAFNDDTPNPPFNYLAELPAGNALYNSLPPGEYLLGVSPWLNHAASSAGQMFPNAYGVVVGPTGVGGGTNTLSGWVANSFSPFGTYRVTLTGAEFIPPPPEMEVQRDSSLIADGGVDAIGDVSTIGQVFTWEIHNVGNGDLNLTGTPVVVVTPGTGNPTVSVTTQPSTTTITPSNLTTFQIEITPDVGAFDFEVSIDNDDPARNPYTFTVSGMGIITNLPAQADAAAGSSFSGGMNGPFTLTLDPSESLANANIELTDPDSDDIVVTAITPPTAIPAGITAPSIGAPAHPVMLSWTGTADAGNDPGDYTWTIDFEDVVNGTPVSITVTITIRDLPPVHSRGGADGGDGTSGDPYTTSYVQGDPATQSVDLATVSDPNTSQQLTLTTVIADIGNPSTGAGFDFSLDAGVLSIAPAAELEAGDAGTHLFEVVVTDGNHSISIHVEVLVYSASGNITFTTASPLVPGRVDQSYSVTLEVDGATAPFTFAIISGGLPSGLTMTTQGTISGMPTIVETATFTVRVTDSSNDTATATFELSVLAKRRDGGSSSSDGCSTGDSAGTSLLALLAAVSAAALVVHRRRRA